MGGGALLVSMKGGVAFPAEDPEQAVLIYVAWCLVTAFETVGVGAV